MVGLPMMQNRKGIVLISSYLAVAVMLVLQSAYFGRIVADHGLSTRHADHLRAIHVADGGLDVALAELATDSGYAGTGGNVALGNGAYAVTVADHPTDSTLKIVNVTGYALDPAQYAADGGTENIEAIIQVSEQFFQYGMFADDDLDLVGSVSIDGYDSRNGAYGNPNWHLTADIGTNNNADRSITFNGSTNAPYTTAWCGPGAGADCVRMTGAAIYAGEDVLEDTISLPTPTPPTTSTTVLTISGGTYVFTEANLAALGGIDGGDGEWALVLQGLSISGSAIVSVDTASVSRLTIYVTGNLSISGSARVGDLTTHNARALVVYYTGTANVTVGGGSTVVASVYAKDASISVNGGLTLYGALVANTLSGTGAYTLRFDRSVLEENVNAGAELVVWKRE